MTVNLIDVKEYSLTCPHKAEMPPSFMLSSASFSFQKSQTKQKRVIQSNTPIQRSQANSSVCRSICPRILGAETVVTSKRRRSLTSRTRDAPTCFLCHRFCVGCAFYLSSWTDISCSKVPFKLIIAR